jgi:predicted lipoprotein with Yx(FWY)xxD motif
MRNRLIRWSVPPALLVAGAVALVLLASASMGANHATVSTAKSAKFGVVLVSSTGKTLYRYTHDKKGVNNCTKVPACAKYWPRLLVKGAAKPTVGGGAQANLVGTIKQPGGLVQVTYAGYPLYMFAGDPKAGTINGQGFEGAWYVVNTSGALVKHAVASPPPAGTTTTSGGGGWG